MLDVIVDRGLGDRQLVGDLLVAEAVANESQHFHLACREILITHVFGKAHRDFRRNSSLAGMNRSDNVRQLVTRHALKNVRRSASPQRTLNLAIAIQRRQHDYARMRKLTTDSDQRIYSITARQPNVHECDAGHRPTKLRQRLDRISSLCHEKHVRLRTNDRAQPLAKHRMILNDQDANGFDVHSVMPPSIEPAEFLISLAHSHGASSYPAERSPAEALLKLPSRQQSRAADDNTRRYSGAGKQSTMVQRRLQFPTPLTSVHKLAQHSSGRSNQPQTPASCRNLRRNTSTQQK